MPPGCSILKLWIVAFLASHEVPSVPALMLLCVCFGQVAISWGMLLPASSIGGGWGAGLQCGYFARRLLEGLLEEEKASLRREAVASCSEIGGKRRRDDEEEDFGGMTAKEQCAALRGMSESMPFFYLQAVHETCVRA